MKPLTAIVRRGATALAALVATAIGAAAWAQTYPSRPVTLIVSFEAGGSTDLSGRAVARELSALLKQPVVVENRPGAGGRIGTRIAALAAPDGHTLLWGSGSSLTAAPALYPDQDHVATLMPVSLGATQSFLFVTTPSLGVATAADFIAYAKARPGELNFASAGTGSSNHLLGEIFMSVSGTRLVHVPYRGAALAKDAVIRAEAHLMDEVTGPLIGAIRAGQVRPLFVTGESRDRIFPEVPTAAEVGLPDLTIEGFFGLLAPAGTPPRVIETLNEAMRAALASEGVRKAFEPLGFVAAYSSPGQMAERIASGKARYAAIISERQIRVEQASRP